MKIIFTTTCLLLATSMTFSQTNNWVTLKDANFAKAIKAILPSSVNEGLQLDTSATEVKSRMYLDVSGKNIQNIEGLHFFKSLRTFTAANNQIGYTSTVIWPATLSELDLSDNELKFFPQGLPDTLERLIVPGNQITSIPNGNVLPRNLIYLHFGNNPVTLSPDLRTLTRMRAVALMQTQIQHVKNLPNSVEHLEFNNGVVRTVDRLPDSLIYLYGQYNHLELIKEGGLPPKLLEANFASNDLEHVPQNHSKVLRYINFDHNRLVDFVLDSTRDIQYVSANYNRIKELSAIPYNTAHFYINHNELTKLPETIPGGNLKFMECTYNYIHKIPDVYFGRAHTSFIGNYNCITEPRNFTDWETSMGRFGYVELPNRPDCGVVTKQTDEMIAEVDMFPNPVKDHVNFRARHADLHEVKIVNDQGIALIFVSNYEDGSNIDLSHLPQGLYVAVLKYADKTLVKKIIKE